MSHRVTAAGVISLVVAGIAALLQQVVTPLTQAVTGQQVVAAAATHQSAMGWTVALDFPVALAASAFLFIGYLAHARRSTLAAVATVFLFVPFVLSLPAVSGLDALAMLAGSSSEPAAMANLVDAWLGSAWFALSVLPYLLLQVVGAILMAVALFKANSVPRWAAIGTAVWPILDIVGHESGSRAVSIAAYALLLATWVAFAVSLTRSDHVVAAEPVLLAR